MKLTILIIAFLFSTKMFAGNETSCSSENIKENIIEMISTKTPPADFDLEGIVTIQFTVDENQLIHIKNINTGNTFLADHVLESLQNKVLNCDCAQPGTVYVLRLQYVQYS